MNNRDDVVSEVRSYYAVIYKWHKKFGVTAYKQSYRDENVEDSPWFKKYVDFLERMPSPDMAETDAIAAAAGEVLWGCMEWSYVKEAEPGLPMNKAAHRIRELLKEAEQEKKPEDQEQALKGLQNIGRGIHAKPHSVEIKLPQQHITQEIYLQFARIAYSDVLYHVQIENIGGQVALADTNLEHEEKHGMEDSGKSTLKFRNAKAMHFQEIQEENSIITLAKSGTISVLSITIGG